MPNYTSFSAGNTELTAAQLNTMFEYALRQSSVFGVPPVQVTLEAGGWRAWIDGQDGCWAIIEDLAGAQYSWREAMLLPGGGFGAKPDGRYGTPDGRWAVEVNSLKVAPGAIVWLMLGVNDGLSCPSFIAPSTRDSLRRPLFWGRLKAPADGRYGYAEVFPDTDGVWREVTGGRQADSPDDLAATEVSGDVGVRESSIVLLFDLGAWRGDDGPVVFRTLGTTITWVQLTGRTKNAIVKIDLDGAAGGWWSGTVKDDGTYEEYEFGPVYAGQAAQRVQDAFDTALGLGRTRVSGDDGGPYDVEFTGPWGGARKVTVTLDASTLRWIGGVAKSPSATRTQDGVEEPYTDGDGNYNWLEVAWNSDGTAAYPKVNGRSCDWPNESARSADGSRKIPPGTIVRLIAGPLGNRIALTGDTTSGTSVEGPTSMFDYPNRIERWACLGLGAAWEFNLQYATGGHWWFRWDTSSNAAVPKTNAKITVFSDTTVNSFRLNWLLTWPRRELNEDGEYETVTEFMPGPLLTKGMTAANVKAALIATYPLLAGNVTVTGGPLGVTLPVTSVSDSACFDTVTADVLQSIVIEFTGELAEIRVAESTFTSGQWNTSDVDGTGSASVSYTQAATGGGTWVFTSEETLASVRGAMARLAAGRDMYGTPHRVPARLSPLTKGNPALARSGPLKLFVAGYPSQDIVPTLIFFDKLTYGDTNASGGVAPVGSDGKTQAVLPLATLTGPDFSHTGRYNHGDGSYHMVLLDTEDNLHFSTLEAATPLSISVSSASVSYLPAAADNRCLAGAAWESGFRTDLPPGQIVRVAETETASATLVEPLAADVKLGLTEVATRWVFTAPPQGFWAIITAPDGSTRGDYLFEHGPARCQFGRAKEVDGCPWVPANSRVFIAPAPRPQAPDATDIDWTPIYQFRYSPASDIRIVFATGAVTGGDAEANAVLDDIDGSVRCHIAGLPNAPRTVAFIGFLSGYTTGSTTGNVIPTYKLATQPGPAQNTIGTMAAVNQSLGGPSKSVFGGFAVTPILGSPQPDGASWDNWGDNTLAFSGVRDGTDLLAFAVEGTPVPDLPNYADMDYYPLRFAADASQVYMDLGFTTSSLSAIPAPPYVIRIDDELMLVTQNCGGTFFGGTFRVLVTRGYGGTTPAPHAAFFSLNNVFYRAYMQTGQSYIYPGRSYLQAQGPYSALGSAGATADVTTIDLPGGYAQTMHFRGGLLCSIDYANPTLVGASHGPITDANVEYNVFFHNGLVASICKIPH